MSIKVWEINSSVTWLNLTITLLVGISNSRFFDPRVFTSGLGKMQSEAFQGL